jgi:hypothetical protein
MLGFQSGRLSGGFSSRGAGTQLFGQGRTPQFGAGFDPSQHVGLPTAPTLQQPLPAPQQAPQPQQGFWQGGGKFRTKDAFAAALAVLSDAAYGQAGIQGGAVGGLAGGRLSAIDLARKEQAEAARRQQERQEGLQDYTAKREIDQRFEAPGSDIELREDNAGNVWHFSKRTGLPMGEQPAWVDRAPKQIVHDGMQINVPNPYMTQTPPPITAADWDRATPLGGEPMSAQQGGAALGAASRSDVITPEEAQRVRQSLGPGGQAKFEEWLRNNSISIGAR